jgi:hypothetical protein
MSRLSWQTLSPSFQNRTLHRTIPTRRHRSETQKNQARMSLIPLWNHCPITLVGDWHKTNPQPALY